MCGLYWNAHNYVTCTNDRAKNVTAEVAFGCRVSSLDRHAVNPLFARRPLSHQIERSDVFFECFSVHLFDGLDAVHNHDWVVMAVFLWFPVQLSPTFVD
jgi:hypothetical protein